MNSTSFPIRILSEKTGVPTATIRAWERRYNILPAQRTASGHRHYTDEDAVYVSHLVAYMEQGMTISKAIREVDSQLQQGQVLQAQVRNSQASQWQYYIDEILLAVGQFDGARLDQAYQQAMALFSVDVVTAQILCPTLVTLGQRWQTRPAGIAEEHFFTTYLRNKIGARLHHHGSQEGPLLVMACLPEERHELGALLFALHAQNNGYRVIALGADLPLLQLPAVVQQSRAQGVILSTSKTQLDMPMEQALGELAKQLAVPLMLGGSIALDTPGGDKPVITLGSDFVAALQIVMASLS